ncbi:MAG: cytidylate kinase family protein [Candidatus Aenigmarchaeota archaeon]|nr:cytidylate kinase family protein [Candidatus Aenigmarchaeota archaeon]
MDYNSIILSGLPGSGKTTLAESLTPIYDWPVFSVGQKIRNEWEVRFPDENISFEEYFRSLTFGDSLIIDHEIRDITERGNVIIDRRYIFDSQHLPVLLVFITAELDVRAERSLFTEKYCGRTVEQIKQILIQREQDELRVSQEMYNADYRDPKYYHIVLNSGLLSVSEEVVIIRSLL